MTLNEVVEFSATRPDFGTTALPFLAIVMSVLATAVFRFGVLASWQS